MKKNKIDERLVEKTKKYYPKTSSWDVNQSLERNIIFSKMVLLTLEKEYKKFMKSWSDFWDLCQDINPEYCFICGRYVIPKMRTDTSRVKRPYKKGDVVHEYCYNKESTVERMTGKLKPESELICHLDLGWSISGSVCRDRVQNNPKSIIEHLVIKHKWNLIPEMVSGEIKEGRYTEKQWKKEIDENNKKWFYDSQIDYDIFKTTHFLRPNGKAFPQRRDF